MSSTVLYAAMADGVFAPYAQFRNGWGSGAFIWNALAAKYLTFDESKDPYLRQFFPSMDDWARVWKYDNEGGDMRPWERNALRTTYDRAVLLRDDMLVVADSLERFEDAHGDGKSVCSLAAQARAIREAYEAGAIGVAWNQTTISEAWVAIRNAETEEDEYYNMLTGTKHHTVEVTPLA